MKKITAIVAAFLCTLSLFAQAKAKSTSGGKVLNILVWDNEFITIFNDYYAAKLPEDVKVNFIKTPSADNQYQSYLVKALKNQNKAPADSKIDLFLVDELYATKFVNSSYTLDVVKDIGLSQNDMTNQFQYTKEIVSVNGSQKAVTWQACPGVFIYRRSIAKKVLGSDKPESVQKAIDSWEKFNAVAEQMKSEGFYMVSDIEDTYIPFNQSKSEPFVSSGKINIPSEITQWITQTKEFTDKHFNHNCRTWWEDWNKDMKSDGKVFGYFVPDWLIDGFMPHDKESASGDWAVCKGPAGFYWGGTWICAASGTDNLDLIKDIMYTLTCDEKVMSKMTNESEIFTNNEKVMKSAGENKKFNDPFLKNQNPIGVFVESAESVKASHLTEYDSLITSTLQNCLYDYFEGNAGSDEALDKFFTQIMKDCPELKKGTSPKLKEITTSGRLSAQSTENGIVLTVKLNSGESDTVTWSGITEENCGYKITFDKEEMLKDLNKTGTFTVLFPYVKENQSYTFSFEGIFKSGKTEEIWEKNAVTIKSDFTVEKYKSWNLQSIKNLEPTVSYNSKNNVFLVKTGLTKAEAQKGFGSDTDFSSCHYWIYYFYGNKNWSGKYKEMGGEWISVEESFADGEIKHSAGETSAKDIADYKKYCAVISFWTPEIEYPLSNGKTVWMSWCSNHWTEEMDF